MCFGLLDASQGEAEERARKRRKRRTAKSLKAQQSACAIVFAGHLHEHGLLPAIFIYIEGLRVSNEEEKEKPKEEDEEEEKHVEAPKDAIYIDL